MLSMNHGLAEAYVMRKHLQEKMKKLDSTSKNGEEKEGSADNKDGGCFPMLKKKIHPNSTTSSDSQ